MDTHVMTRPTSPTRRSARAARLFTAGSLLAATLAAATSAFAPAIAAAAPKFTPHVPCAGWDGRTDLPAGTTCRTITVDGYAREYFVYVPAGLPTGAVPLVVMHHGSSGNGAQFARGSGWREQAAASKFIVAFPTGLQYWVTKDVPARWSTKWNSVHVGEEIDVNKRLPGYPATAPWPADDVKFERALIADVATLHPIDANRIYATGFSNGSAFSTRLATDMSDTFAAVASSGGSDVDLAGLARLGAAGTPPMWGVMGTADDRLTSKVPPGTIVWDRDRLLALTLRLPNYSGILNSLALDRSPCRTEQTKTTITFGFCSPGWSASTTPEYRMTWVKDLTHRYPTSAPALFWKFFSSSPKAGGTAAR